MSDAVGGAHFFPWLLDRCMDDHDRFAAVATLSLIALARAAGIEEVEGQSPSKAKVVEEDDEDTGLELNASIALRKLAIKNESNYKKMCELLSPDDLRYFLHGEMPTSSG